MERRLEARICTDTQRKPDLHHENKNEPQVYLLYSTQAYFILVFSFSLACITVAIITVKWKRSLDCCSLVGSATRKNSLDPKLNSICS